jgi:hypothetical protein
VRSIAHVEFNYDKEGRWTGSTFLKHAGYGTGKHVACDKQATLWTKPQRRTGVSIIEHKSQQESVLERLVDVAQDGHVAQDEDGEESTEYVASSIYCIMYCVCTSFCLLDSCY